jgi:transposase, IS5 family
MAGQLSFVEAFLATKAGQNRRLERIAALLDWSPFAAILKPLGSSGGPGRPSYAPLMMFKALLLAQWYQLSDPALEEALADRISFHRFCGFALDAVTPDETTIWRFRDAVAAASLGEALLAELDRQLGVQGFLVKEGTMIDATLIEAQAARPRDDRVNDPPASGRPAEPRVDPDAAFTRKGGKSIYGYSAHVAVDRGSGLIRRARLTPANVHDGREADALVMGDERAIYADKAYASHARRAALKSRGIKDRIMHRPNKHHPELPRWQRRRNELISAARAAIERTFGTLKRSYGYRRVRYFSLAANAVELQLKCFAFNLRRLVVLAARPV